MYKKLPAVFAVTAALMLSGCAGNSETPFFELGKVDKAVTAGDTKPYDSPETEETKPEESKESPKEDTSALSPEEQEKLEDNSAKIAEEEGLKLDENGNPYTEEVYVAEQKSEEQIKVEEEARKKSNSPDPFQVSAGDTGSVIDIFFNYQDSLEKEDWDTACSYIYLEEGESVEDCIDGLKATYENASFRESTLTKDNAEFVQRASGMISVFKKDADYKESEHVQFMKDKDGNWKMLPTAI